MRHRLILLSWAIEIWQYLFMQSFRVIKTEQTIHQKIEEIDNWSSQFAAINCPDHTGDFSPVFLPEHFKNQWLVDRPQSHPQHQAIQVRSPAPNPKVPLRNHTDFWRKIHRYPERRTCSLHVWREIQTSFQCVHHEYWTRKECLPEKRWHSW